jgi:ubiquinone/menaquinone biosynthesis C-methylase UbiE
MLQPKSTILDLGCGPGHYAKEFQNAGHVVDLLDCSQPALDIAQKKLDPLGCPRNVFLGDITQASFRGRVPIGARYDGIWCSGVMVHIPSTAWPEILLWIRSLLAPAGALFVNVMIDNPCLFARDGRYFTYLRSATEFEQTLVKAGFDVSHYLSKNIARNTYGEPLIQRSWANFYAKPSGASDSDFGSVAATMTGLAYERSFKAFASCHLGQDRQRFIEAELAVLLEYLKNPVGRRILDLGCGTGDFLKALANEGYTAVGVDISEQMIGLSKSQTADVRTGSVTLELCDMCELPRNWTSTFDAALCITALQHQPIIGGRFDKALSELYRVLKPGGIARIDSRIGLDSGFDPDLRYIQAFSNKQEVIEHIHRAGFELATIPEPHSWTLPARQNSFRRDIDLSFVEFWLRKRTRD